MIDIVYHRGYHRVCVKGHAKSAEIGHDLVCAGVSALVLTLVANVRRLEKQGCTRQVDISVGSGNAEISVDPTIHYRFSTMQIMDSVCAGFEVLAEQYPEYVRYQLLHSDDGM